MTAFDNVRSRVVDAVGDRIPFERATGGAERSSNDGCRCRTTVATPPGTGIEADEELRVDASDCPGAGELASSPGCRARVVRALDGRGVARIRVRRHGTERVYDGDGRALLTAASGFAVRAARHDPELAARARWDPLAAARVADGRAGPVARAAAETGLAEAVRFDDYPEALSPAYGLPMSNAVLDPTPSAPAERVDRRELSTGATVTRLRGGSGPLTYHLRPLELGFADRESAALAAAYRRMAGDHGLVDDLFGRDGGEPRESEDAAREPTTDAGGGGARAAVETVAATRSDDVGTAASESADAIAAVLARHTGGAGWLADCFADDRVTDAYVSAPVAEHPLRVVVDGTVHVTNVRFTADGTAALASRLRRASGRSFSRASPRVDATISLGPGEGTPSRSLDDAVETDSLVVRAAGVTRPLSDGTAFALRRRADGRWTLPRLVASMTMPAEVAGLLSVAVERGGATLVTGPRGAGKTTLLGALLWELPGDVRTVVVEDTPELPVRACRRRDRDVQRLAVETGVGGVDDSTAETSPTTALRTALRLGGGALVVGEVRGEEAATLYEAMRVGAADEAVLGTVHGEDAASVRERVVTDLGVPVSSFAATDLVVSMRKGRNGRHVHRVEEVRPTDDDVAFATLYGAPNDDLSGIVPQGDSVTVASLAGPDETYADVLAELSDRADRLQTLGACDAHRPADRRAGTDEP